MSDRPADDGAESPGRSQPTTEAPIAVPDSPGCAAPALGVPTRTPPAHAAPPALDQLLLWCRADPVLFNQAILGRPPYWSAQAEIARAVVRYRTTIAPTGNAVGKSYLAAGLVLWWLYTRPDSLVIVTAPSHTLVASVVFKEIRRAWAGARVQLPGCITHSLAASPQTLLVNATGWQVLGIATRGVERLSGQHNPELLVVVDEASGVEPEIWDALRSQNAAKIVVFGNPLRAEGEFVELHQHALSEADDATIADDQRVVEIRVASTDSPDIDLPRSPRGLADAGWLHEVLRTYGADSLYVRTHVEGLFPEVSSDTLLPAAWLDRCTTATRPPPQPYHPSHGIRRLACDLGEGVGRNRTVILVRDDLGILEVVADKAMGLEEAAAAIAHLSRKWTIQPGQISYDKLGIGQKLHHHLVRQNVAHAVPYAGSGSPKRPRDFANIRSEAAWALHLRLDPDWMPHLKSGQRQPPFQIAPLAWWASLRQELAALSYDFVDKRTRLLSKQDWCARLGRSPDLGDALIQSFFMG